MIFCYNFGAPLTIFTWKTCVLLNSVQKFIEMQGWLLLTHQIDSKNEWLLLSVTFKTKLELIFVLTFENAFS